jgi:hypothetical protein
LITNNFKIKSKREHGVIYTYKVDFLETTGPGGATRGTEDIKEQEDLNAGMQMMNLGRGAAASTNGSGGLETFQKFRIMNTEKEKLKSIFQKYVFVGNNLFSTDNVEGKITLELSKPFYNRFYTIIIERVSEFLLDDLNSMKMEDHPFALSFINSIIKSCLRNSKLT